MLSPWLQEVEPLVLWRLADLELLGSNGWAGGSLLWLGGHPACHAPEMTLSLKKPGKRPRDPGLPKMGAMGHLRP